MTRATTARIQLPVLPAGAANAEAASAAVHAVPAPTPAATAASFALITLGCDKNTVDSERLLATLAAAGARVAERAEDADVVVVNTCGFIDLAKEESVETLLEAVRRKEQGRVRAVVAVGCLIQRYQQELREELPEVDLMLGLAEADRLVPELRSRGFLPAAEADVPTMERPLRLLTTGTTHTSYLKISEGCDHGCAFCAIPLMRGKHRSTPIERLVREALELQAAGVVELNVVSQDTTWYGRDLLRGRDRDRDGDSGGEGGGEGEGYFVGRPFAGMAGPRPDAGTRRRGDAAKDSGHSLAASPRPRVAGSGASRRGLLPDLLGALLRGTDIPWFRLFYMYPSGISRELVELVAREDRILPYLDMPIQHGADRILERMRRPERRATIRERVGWLREAIPDLVLRTTVIVGFPGEEDEDFEALLELLEEIRFDRVGAFQYSTEEGTRAAGMDGQVPDAVKRERLERLLELQSAISLERNEALIGRELDVLIDRVEAGGAAIGRTAGQALEVDGVTRVAGLAGSAAGEFIRVRVEDATEHDLVARPVAAEA